MTKVIMLTFQEFMPLSPVAGSARIRTMKIIESEYHLHVTVEAERASCVWLEGSCIGEL